MTMPSPPGWYPDPHGAPLLRWFSGVEWTAHTTAPQAFQPQPPSEALNWILPVNRHGSAIAAGYVGLFGLVIVFLMPVSIGLGIWGLQVIKRDGTLGKGRCWFAIGSGVWDVLLLLLIAR